ncbi:MAG: lytic transglycosylase domain-containing protein, partial [Burkholderiaceae bacterium]|nr:lytic transglycosylase domain-containing protein [Burkholderiaceae bacterium]
MAALATPGLALAQAPGGDAALLEMRAAYSRGNSFQLANLLPTMRGHALEPLANYWSIRSRLDIATPLEIRAALDRMAGTYWEDRLRNDWLLQLGKARDWANFDAELPRFRMNDDRQVRCYALMRDVASGRG